MFVLISFTIFVIIICLYDYFCTGPHSHKLCFSWGPSDFAVNLICILF